MESTEVTRMRSPSHKDYLESLHQPSAEEWQRISDYQKQREVEIDRKYHTAEEHEAATKIQKAYRGHRVRRQLEGLTLDPSSRWTEIIKEWRYRSATVPHRNPSPSLSSSDGRTRAVSDAAKLHWERVVQIAERAGGGGEARSPPREANDYSSVKSHADAIESEEAADSMLLDMRYFLEMVDQKHRYGANLLVYHEEWLRPTATHNFFYWLDFGEGRNLDLPGCSRERLDRERIRYLSKDERLNYLTVVDNEGKIRWYKNNELITTSSEQFKDSMTGVVAKEDEEVVAFDDEEVSKQLSDGRRLARQMARAKNPNGRRSSDSSIATSYDGSDSDQAESTGKPATKTKKRLKSLKVSPATILNKLLRAAVKPGTWIYVADTVGRLYVGIKSSGAFQHASFLSGARISSAGSIGIENGQLTYLSPLSGHYRPTTKSFRVFITALEKQGVDMSQLRVSHAFEVLLSMEYYSKSKKGMRHMVQRKHEKDKHSEQHDDFGQASPELDAQFHMAMDDYSATSLVEQNWKKEHRSSLGKMMDDLRIRRRSFVQEKKE